jgi:hypothetical protein
VEEGIANAGLLSGSVIFAFSGIRVIPGTPLVERAVKDGVLAADQDLLAPFFYFSPRVDRAWMEKRIRQAWKGDLRRIFPASSMQERISFLHGRGHVGPMWDMLCRAGGRR